MISKKIYYIFFVQAMFLLAVSLVFVKIDFESKIDSIGDTSETRLVVQKFGENDQAFLEQLGKKYTANFIYTNYENNRIELASVLGEVSDLEFFQKTPLFSDELLINKDTSGLIDKENVVFTIYVSKANEQNLINELKIDQYQIYGKKSPSNAIFQYVIIVLGVIFAFGALLFLYLMKDLSRNNTLIVNYVLSGKTNIEILSKCFGKLVSVSVILFIFLVAVFVLFINPFTSIGKFILLLYLLYNIGVYLFIFFIYLKITKNINEALKGKIILKFNLLLYVIKSAVSYFLIILVIFFGMSALISNEKIAKTKKVFEPIIGFGYIDIKGAVDYVTFQKESEIWTDYILNNEKINKIYFDYYVDQDIENKSVTAPVVKLNKDFFSKYYPNAQEGTIYVASDYKNLDFLVKSLERDNSIANGGDGEKYQIVKLAEKIEIPNFDYQTGQNLSTLSSENVAMVVEPKEALKNYGNVAGGATSNIKINIDEIGEEQLIEDLVKLEASETYRGFITYDKSIMLLFDEIKSKIISMLLIMVLLIVIFLFFNYYVILFYTQSNKKIILLKYLKGEKLAKIYRMIITLSSLFYFGSFITIVGVIYVKKPQIELVFMCAAVIIVSFIFEILVINFLAKKLTNKHINAYMKGMEC
ncbi:MAG: hypothetical protein ACRCUP_03485 [Mycoplasmatales bacterium]